MSLPPLPDPRRLTDACRRTAAAEGVQPYLVGLVDQKLAEVRAAPLAEQPASFGLTAAERRELEGPALGDLIPVLRHGAPPFDLAAVIRHYDALWASRLAERRARGPRASAAGAGERCS